MSDPFGDGNPVEGDIPQEISDFAPPVDNSNDFYEVEPTEATTNGTYEENTEQSFDQHDEESFEQHQESFQPMDFAPAPVEDVPAADFQAEIPAAPMEIPAQIPVVEEDNELTKFMREYEEKIALKAQEQEKVAVECKSKAEEDMAQFLAERQRIKESKMQANRVFEQATLEKMVADLQNENPWERVVTLVDLETSRKKKLDALNNNNNKKDGKKQDPKPVAVPAKKTKEDEEDVSRMRQLFVQLKATPLEQTRADAVAAN